MSIRTLTCSYCLIFIGPLWKTTKIQIWGDFFSQAAFHPSDQSNNSILFPLSVCPSDCQSSVALQVLTARCQGKKSCLVRASTRDFGDPCYSGTRKYLSVIYTCGESQHTFAQGFIFFTTGGRCSLNDQLHLGLVFDHSTCCPRVSSLKWALLKSQKNDMSF